MCSFASEDSSMFIKPSMYLKDGREGSIEFERTRRFFFPSYKEVHSLLPTGFRKMSLAINKYLKTTVASGELVQTKGKEALCSFKLPAAPARGRRAASIAPKKIEAACS
jgi:hypothetical protein